MTPETDDTSHALLRFASGAMGAFSTSWTAADAPGFHIDVFGSQGRLRLEALAYPSATTARLVAAKSQFSLLPAGEAVEVPQRLFTVGGKVVEVDAADSSGGQKISLARLFDRVAQAVRGGPEPLVSFARSAEIQGVVEALYQSHERKAWVDAPRG
jgi:predicted dehydrogenase